MKYIDNEVTFNGIEHAGLITGGPKLSKGKYELDNNGNIMYNMPIINAIDIDWNNASVEGLLSNINTTGDLIKTIAGINISLQSTISDLGENDEALQSLLQKINEIQDILNGADNPEEPGSTGESTPNIISRIKHLEDLVDLYHTEYSFKYTLTNVSANNSNPVTMKKNDSVVLEFTPTTGYIMPDNLTVQNASYVYNKNAKTVTITNPTNSQIEIIINATDKVQCTFNIPTLNRMTCELVANTKTVFTVGETFDIKLTLTGDSDLWALPDNISGTKCTVTSYNSTTGIATLRCDGSGDMTINASAKDVAVYRFAVALETNSIFTTGNETITNMNAGTNGANIAALQGALSATGTCPVNFANGFNAPSSVNVEGAYVWFIIPSKFFQDSTFNFINGSNKYVLKQSNIQDLTINTKIKNCVTIPAGNGNKIQYTLVCVSNNGLGGKQEFKKL